MAAVIFDMDGVLIDSTAVYERHWRAWAAGHGLDPEAPVAVHHGHPAVETIRLVAPHLDASGEAAAYNRTLAADASADGVVELPGARAALECLSDARGAIATSTSRLMADRWLALLRLPVPDVLVTIEDVLRGKPAPDPYLTAAKRLEVEPGRCLVFEDAPPGIAAARAAGCAVVALATTHPRDVLEEADAIVADLDAVSLQPDGPTIVASWAGRGRD